jgi:uncharacterized membrane protein
MSNETKKTETTETLMGPPAPKIEKYDHIGHVYLIVVAAIVSYAVTEIVKPFIFKTCAEKSEAVIRLFAVITGAIVGYSLSNDILDLWLGASAGALNAYVIKIIKSKIKSTVGVELTPTPSEEGGKEK